jgi:hypothetical protein
LTDNVTPISQAPLLEESKKTIPRLPPAEERILAGTDDQATKETLQLSSGKTLEDLQHDAAKNEHERTESFRDLFDALIKIAVVLGFAAIVLFGATWVWHLLMPSSWHWLTEQDVDHIQNIVTGGVIATLVGDHFKRRLG